MSDKEQQPLTTPEQLSPLSDRERKRDEVSHWLAGIGACASDTAIDELLAALSRPSPSDKENTS